MSTLYRECAEGAYARGYSEGRAAALRESRQALIVQRERKRRDARAEMAQTIADATAILARIGIDPDAAQHRHEVSQW
ncbi:MAG: hypothetical protein J0H73_11795 [Salana multivorans]|uniref:hypothetical protein n=1 Tax=Salana multivorans TaxID=120377 RepID=UPI00095A4D5F|nr:hypothetical protein [Salana multivorans]MBN8882982.1 hypothetical protein [Salana multivorans]OJX94065.1 MAG: hypothetical protein BGO96_09670 [Micrococcales bacterium 73-15]